MKINAFIKTKGTYKKIRISNLYLGDESRSLWLCVMGGCTTRHQRCTQTNEEI